MKLRLDLQVKQIWYLTSGFLVVLSISIYFFIVGTFVEQQVSWKSNFNDAVLIGSKCSVAEQGWRGSYEETMRSLGPLRENAMPHRGTPNPPRIFSESTLYTVCQVDLTSMPLFGFAWMYLGKVFGASKVFLQGRELASTAGGEVIEFPIPIEARGQIVILEIISRGTAEGAVGLATLIPPFATEKVEVLRKVKNYLNSAEREQALTHVVKSALFLSLFIAIWWYGLRFQDLGWMIVFLSSICCLHFLRYASQYDVAEYKLMMRRGASALYFLAVLAQIMFLTSFVRIQKLTRMVMRVMLLPTLALICTSFLASEMWFFKMRLLVLTPTIFSIVGMVVLTFALLFYRKHYDNEKAAARRAKVLKILCLFLPLLSVQAILDDRFGIYIDSLVHTATMFFFSAVALLDLLERQRLFFHEKTERAAAEEKLIAAQVATRTVQFLAHDIIKPYALVHDFMSQLQNMQSSSELEVYCKSFLGSMAKIQSRTVELMGRMVSGESAAIPADKTLNLNRFVEEYLNNELTELQAMGVHFQTELGDSVGFIRIEPMTLDRILSNILDNAFKAMKSNQVSNPIVRITTSDTESTVLLTVFNTGTFVDPSMRQSIFDLGVKSGNHARFGLGLSYVREALGRFNAKIDCHSDQNGTSFNIYFPKVREGNAFDTGALVQTKRKKVLVVDDDEFVLVQWSIFAKRSNAPYTVVTLNNPRSVLVAIESGELNLFEVMAIVLDENFGDDSELGSALAVKLRSYPGCPPILTSSELARSLPCFDGYAGKGPIEIADLRRLLSSSLIP